MKTISTNTRHIDLPDYTEHYQGIGNERLVKCSPSIEECNFNLHFSATGEGYQQSMYSVSYNHAMSLIKLFLAGPEAVTGECFEALINQAERDCEVIQVNRTRCRIWYELPNSGDTEAWRHIVTLAGIKFVDDCYSYATHIMEKNA